MVRCPFIGPHTGRQCIREDGHAGLHNTWGGEPIVEVPPPVAKGFRVPFLTEQ